MYKINVFFKKKMEDGLNLKIEGSDDEFWRELLNGVPTPLTIGRTVPLNM